MTNDRELIAMHDPEVTRTTNSEGFVGDFDVEEIKDLDAGTWFNEANPDMG